MYLTASSVNNIIIKLYENITKLLKYFFLDLIKSNEQINAKTGMYNGIIILLLSVDIISLFKSWLQ